MLITAISSKNCVEFFMFVVLAGFWHIIATQPAHCVCVTRCRCQQWKTMRRNASLLLVVLCFDATTSNFWRTCITVSVHIAFLLYFFAKIKKKLICAYHFFYAHVKKSRTISNTKAFWCNVFHCWHQHCATHSMRHWNCVLAL